MGTHKKIEPIRVDYIPVKFDIWDTCYKVVDYGRHLMVTMPCRAYVEGSEGETWQLGCCSQCIDKAEKMKLIRMMVVSGKPVLCAKDGVTTFSFEQVLNGWMLDNGWTANDFAED